MNDIHIPTTVQGTAVSGTAAPGSRIVTHAPTPVASREAGSEDSSLELTTTAAAGGPVFDRAKVDAIRGEIAAGNYVVDGRAVAKGLLAQTQVLQEVE